MRFFTEQKKKMSCHFLVHRARAPLPCIDVWKYTHKLIAKQSTVRLLSLLSQKVGKDSLVENREEL